MLKIIELGNYCLLDGTPSELKQIQDRVLVQARDKEKDVLVLYSSSKEVYNSTSTSSTSIVFRSGLLKWVLREITSRDILYELERLPKIPIPSVPEDLLADGPEPIILRDYQRVAIRKGMSHRRGIFNIATGGGKCLAPETPVLLHNGELKTAEAIRVGDELMGPDSRPRKVLSTTTGVGPMYRITPVKGNSWVCNDAHILCLKNTLNGDVVEISVVDYLKTNKTFKHLYKQYTTGVEFDAEPVWEPYFVGLWLGDGSKTRYDNGKIKSVKVTNIDSEVIEELRSFADRHECYLYESSAPGKAPDWFVSSSRGQENPALTELRATFPDNLKLPLAYRCASRGDRLELLAGLLDADGHLHHGFFEIAQKSAFIADDIEFLARSLGLFTTRRIKYVDGTPYHKINILGDVEQLPTKILRKRANYRKQKKDACRSGIKVEAIGEGPYAGFTISGDGRFLLGDFVVTHNTEIIIGIAKMSGNSLTIVPSKSSLKQTYARFKKRGLDDVGMLGGGHGETTCEHTIATASIINSRLKKKDKAVVNLLNRVGLLMFDEVHHLGTAPSWQKVAKECPALRRFGFSGSPWASGWPYIDLSVSKESKFADYRVTAEVGGTLVYIPSKMLRDMGVIVDPLMFIIEVNEPKGLTKKPFPQWRWVYGRGIIENEHRNNLIVEAATRLTHKEHRTAILVVSIPHGTELLKRLHDKGLSAAFTKGDDEVLIYTGKKVKRLKDAGEKYRDAFIAGDLDVLIGSVVIDEAVDLPNMTALILAGGMKSPIRAVQRIGRAIRTAVGKDMAIVLDFRDRQHFFLNNHTNKRLGIYSAHEYDYEEVKWDQLWERI